MSSKYSVDRRKVISLGALSFSSVILNSIISGSVAAQELDKITRLVVPFPPGGSTDVLARRIAEFIMKRTGETVVVENRAGAGGTIGANYVAKSEPNGRTILLGVTGSNAIAQSLMNLPYDSASDFAPITRVVNTPLIITINQTLPVNTLNEFIDYILKHPNEIYFGSAGTGTSMHLTGEMFKNATHTQMTHVPYKGNGAMLTDLLGGQIQATFGDILVLKSHIDSGKLKALAVTSRARHPMFPKIPAVAEAGFGDFEALSWQGFFAPKNTPSSKVTELSELINDSLKDPTIRTYFEERGVVIDGTTPEQFSEFVHKEIKKWADIVKIANVKI